MNDETTEYEVRERSEVLPDGWYRHGYSGFDRTEAFANLKYMRSRYSKYGREFALFARPVGKWRNKGY